MKNVFCPLPQDLRLRDHARALRGNATESERALWRHIRGQLLGVRFRRQHIVEPFILDFYCVELKLAVELDGGQHNDDEKPRDDLTRTRFLESSGISVLRYWNNDVLADIAPVLTHLCCEIERLRGAKLPPH